MTYVPPEEKKSGGTSSFGDVIYVILFYLVEGMFIFLGIPMLVLAIGVIPVAMYVIITEGRYTQWPLYVAGVFVILLQVFGVQYFLRKYVLEPNNKSFGQWIRWKFSPTEIRSRRAEKREKSEKIKEWYDGFDRVKDHKERLKEEQSQELFKELFPEISEKYTMESLAEEDSSITLGETQVAKINSDVKPVESTIISSNSIESNNSDIIRKEKKSEEDKEENNEIDIEW